MRSIKELSAEANSYPFSPNVSFPSWVHVCQTLQREAKVYDHENDSQGIERAFILYLRMADLVLNRLPRHPGFAAHKKQYSRVCNQVPEAIARSEALKKRLEARLPAPAANAPNLLREPTLNKAENLVEEPLQAHGTEEDPLEDLDLSSADISLDDSLRATLQSLKLSSTRPTSNVSVQPSRLPYKYPTLVESRPTASKPVVRDALNEHTSVRPPIDTPGDGHSLSAQHKSVFTTEKGEPLRPVYVPASLRARFLELATKNTRANLETCGILCGKLSRNAFFITNLVVPHQTSTSDSCDMTNEEELFDYADKRDLFIVGWIHTHPSQSCFMSSIDLHTQAGYQIMLPEAIAIVCAPRSDPSWGVFRLTDPPGIDVIKNCRQTGFHPHPQSNLYKLATPGHVKEISFQFEDVDLRNKKI